MSRVLYWNDVPESMRMASATAASPNGCAAASLVITSDRGHPLYAPCLAWPTLAALHEGLRLCWSHRMLKVRLDLASSLARRGPRTRVARQKAST